MDLYSCGNPRELKLIAHSWYEGDPKVVEDFVHTQFSHKRILREWYALTMEEIGDTHDYLGSSQEFTFVE